VPPRINTPSRNAEFHSALYQSFTLQDAGIIAPFRKVTDPLVFRARADSKSAGQSSEILRDDT